MLPQRTAQEENGMMRKGGRLNNALTRTTPLLCPAPFFNLVPRELLRRTRDDDSVGRATHPSPFSAAPRDSGERLRERAAASRPRPLEAPCWCLQMKGTWRAPHRRRRPRPSCTKVILPFSLFPSSFFPTLRKGAARLMESLCESHHPVVRELGRVGPAHLRPSDR